MRSWRLRHGIRHGFKVANTGIVTSSNPHVATIAWPHSVQAPPCSLPDSLLVYSQYTALSVLDAVFALSILPTEKKISGK